MIYLLTAIGLSPGGSSTVHIHTQTIHRTTQNKQYIERHKHFGRVQTVPRLGIHATAQMSSRAQEEQNLGSGIRTAINTSKCHLLRGVLSCDTVYTGRFVTVF
jgi:hypothetical protein